MWSHRLGTDASDDTMVFEENDEQYFVTAWADRSGDLLVVFAYSTNTTETWLVDSHRPQAPAWVVTPRERGIDYRVAHRPGPNGGDLLVVTNDGGAVERRLMQAPRTTSQRSDWREVIAATTDVRIHDVEVFARHLVLPTVTDARQQLRVFPLDTLASGVSVNDGLVIEAEYPRGVDVPVAQRGA